MCLLLSGSLAGQKDSLKTQTDNKILCSLDSIVDEPAKRFIQSPQNCALSIGISQNGVTHFYNYGEVSRGSNQLPNENTLYEIGSVSSTFCGLLLAQAVSEKKISLEDDICRYLPGKYPNLQFDNKPILIKHLANHSSGLPGVPENLKVQANFDSLNPYKNYTTMQVLSYLKTVSLIEAPGSVTDYSSLGMALLGFILSEIYHQSFDSLIQEKICTPVHMNSTRTQVSKEQEDRFAPGYDHDGQSTPHWELNAFAPAGGLRSTTSDLLTYLDYNLAEQSEATRLAHRISFSSKQSLGLGWFIKKTTQGKTLVWHNGGTYGFSCFCGFIKESKCSLVILSNSPGSLDFIGLRVLKYLQGL